MKKVIFSLLVIIIIILLGYFTYQNNTTNDDSLKNIALTENDKNPRHLDPSNATFIFDDGPITLLNGKNEKAVSPNSALMEEIILLDKLAYGDINSDNKEDTALFLARYGAGSGTFIYLAALASGPVAYKGSKVIFIGDRISPQSIVINDNVITVKYLSRGFDEPFTAEPTIQVSKNYIFSNGELQEN